MGIRFRKSVKVMPGVRLNISKSGVSTTVGARGASVNIGKQGVYGNAGIPGTGLSVRERISKPKSTKISAPSQPSPKVDAPSVLPPVLDQNDQITFSARFWEGYFTRGLKRNRRSYLAATFAWLTALFLVLVAVAFSPEVDETAGTLIFLLSTLVYIWAQIWISIQRARDAGMPSFISGLVLFLIGPIGWIVGAVVPSQKVSTRGGD